MNKRSVFARIAVCGAVLFTAPYMVQAAAPAASTAKTAPPAPAASSPATTTVTPQSPASSATTPTTATQPAVGRVRIYLLVPEKKDCVDSFIIYPYPVKPPTNEKKLKKLPKNMKELRKALFNEGYAGRVTASKTYPSQGWRWRYIFQTAITKSGQYPPNSVLTAYTWVDDVVPYAIPELKKVNAAERRRVMRYDKAMEFWDLNSVDIENAATQAGRHPHEIAFNKNWIARAQLPEGIWWVVGTHRIAGLIFYWQEPFKIIPGKVTTVNLDEWNALVVQGDW